MTRFIILPPSKEWHLQPQPLKSDSHEWHFSQLYRFNLNLLYTYLKHSYISSHYQLKQNLTNSKLADPINSNACDLFEQQINDGGLKMVQTPRAVYQLTSLLISQIVLAYIRTAKNPTNPHYQVQQGLLLFNNNKLL